MSDKGNARDRVIGAIRKGLGARGDEPGRRGQVRARLERSPNGLIPSRARTPKAELIEQFSTRIAAQGAVVREIETFAELPKAIAEQLTEFNLPARLRHGDDPVLGALDWEGTLVERDHGPAVGDDAVGLSHAVAGAAETGTLFLTSGTDNPSTLNFLPETHFIVLLADDLKGSYEEFVGRSAGDPWPRHAPAHRQPGQRPLRNGRYRADAHPRSARSAPARHISRKRKSARPS